MSKSETKTQSAQDMQEALNEATRTRDDREKSMKSWRKIFDWSSLGGAATCFFGTPIASAVADDPIVWKIVLGAGGALIVVPTVVFAIKIKLFGISEDKVKNLENEGVAQAQKLEEGKQEVKASERKDKKTISESAPATAVASPDTTQVGSRSDDKQRTNN
jgi:hypothetical protein